TTMTNSAITRPASTRACPSCFVLSVPRAVRWTGEPVTGKPADPRRRRQQPFATALLPRQWKEAVQRWLGRPCSVMSLGEGPCRTAHSPLGSHLASDFWFLVTVLCVPHPVCWTEGRARRSDLAHSPASRVQDPSCSDPFPGHLSLDARSRHLPCGRSQRWRGAALTRAGKHRSASRAGYA